MTQVEIIICALKKCGGKASYKDIYTQYEEIVGHKLSYGQKAGIRKCIEDHSSDSDNYKAEDLFYSVEGKGNGIWGLR